MTVKRFMIVVVVEAEDSQEAERTRDEIRGMASDEVFTSDPIEVTADVAAVRCGIGTAHFSGLLG